MTEQIPNIAPEPGAEPPAIEPVPAAAPVSVPPAPPATGKSHKTFWIVAGSIVSVLCLCALAVLAVTVPTLIKSVIAVMQERAPVTAVLDSFMQKMTARDTRGAYALFSPRAQRQVPVSTVEKLDQGNNYVLFEGYQSLTVDNLTLTAALNTNPDVPQGTLANVSATVTYEGGFKGKLTGTLEKVNGVWMIDRVYVTVPPDKLQP